MFDKKKIYIGILISLLLPSLVFAYDYTQNCIATGELACHQVETCVEEGNCHQVIMGCDTSCPSQTDPNSHYETKACGIIGNWNCTCEAETCGGTASCGIAWGNPGGCKYNCNEGYVWEVDECVLEAPPPPTYQYVSFPTDFTASLKATVGELFDDLKIPILLIISLPIAFWFISKAVSVVQGGLKDKKE